MTGTAALDDYAHVSNPDGEPIAVWERVSTDMTKQEIAAQTRDLVAFIGAGSYNVVRVFRFEASAFKGKHTASRRRWSRTSKPAGTVPSSRPCRRGTSGEAGSTPCSPRFSFT